MATRHKTKATAAAVPQSKTDCAAYIRSLGDLQREFERQRAEMNDAIAAITQYAEPGLSALGERMLALQTGIQTWCEANRVALCGEADRLGKTANLVTGEVAWRQVPPSVQVRGADAVIDRLQVMGLGRFVRSKDEVNKEAMLAEPEAVRGIAGITIVTGLENFSITPFEASAEVPA